MMERRANIFALPLEPERPRAAQELDVPDRIDPPPNKSHLSDPTRIARLMLIMCLAYLE
jgi:hypothetical protein